ncbi:unnamed protein product [Prunus armeniaca]
MSEDRWSGCSLIWWGGDLDNLHLAFKGTWACFVRHVGLAVRGSLVIDVASLYPFDLPKTAQRPRPMNDSLFRCVVRDPRVVLLLDEWTQCMPNVNKFDI